MSIKSQSGGRSFGFVGAALCARSFSLTPLSPLRYSYAGWNIRGGHALRVAYLIGGEQNSARVLILEGSSSSSHLEIINLSPTSCCVAFCADPLSQNLYILNQMGTEWEIPREISDPLSDLCRFGVEREGNADTCVMSTHAASISAPIYIYKARALCMWYTYGNFHEYIALINNF